VGALLVTLRRASPRAGGLAAAVPINSMPALFWLSLEHGGRYAATAALGSLWGTGLIALLGLVFARFALVYHAALAGVVGCFAIGALAALIWTLPVALTIATALALIAILAGNAGRLLPLQRARTNDESQRDTLRSMCTAGAMSLVVS